MGLSVKGAGLYGSIGVANTAGKIGRPAAGNSKLMKASSIDALNGVAQAQTRKFIENGKQVARGASGKSRISIKA